MIEYRGPNGRDSGSDADARGEHVYGDEAPRRLPIPPEENGFVRKPGEYVAGAEGTQMIHEPKPPRNRDQDLPPRKGETVETPGPDRGQPEPGKREPLTEEETYERRDDRQR